jgi:cation diffusion facilitator family transporter
MAKSTQSFMIPDYGDSKDPVVRAKYGYLEATVSILGNTALFLLKLFLGLFINSIALITDGFHSLSDVSTSGVVILGFRIAKKQPDKEHPFGHGRAEHIATLIIAVLLIMAGFSFIQQAIGRIIDPQTIAHQEYALAISVIVLISAVVKELMARFSFTISKRIKSDVLSADAWHHRSDAISSIGVAISIIGSRYGFPILDPIFGIVVSVIIIYVGITLIRTSSNFLMGQSLDKKTIEKIGILAKSTDGVKGVHKISLHDYGTTKVITLHAEVDNNLTLDMAHAIADTLENRIQEKTLCSTIIHLEPKEMHIDMKTRKRIIETILSKQKEIISFHKIQIIRGIENDDLKMHLIVDKDMPTQSSHELCHRLKSNLQKEYGPCDVDIHFEPCGKDCKICTISCQKRIL